MQRCVEPVQTLKLAVKWSSMVDRILARQSIDLSIQVVGQMCFTPPFIPLRQRIHSP